MSPRDLAKPPLILEKAIPGQEARGFSRMEKRLEIREVLYVNS
jgi:hypothetical protein